MENPIQVAIPEKLSVVLSAVKFKFDSVYEDLSSFRRAFDHAQKALSSTGLVQTLKASVTTDGAVLDATCLKPSLSAGISLNQNGNPCIEGSFSYPFLAPFRPWLLNVDYTDSFSSSPAMTAKLCFPRRTNDSFDFNTKLSRSPGLVINKELRIASFCASTCISFDSGTLGLLFESRENFFKSDRVNSNYLRSDRFSLFLKLYQNYTRYFAAHTAFPARGLSFGCLLDCPLMLGDSEVLKVACRLSHHIRLAKTAVWTNRIQVASLFNLWKPSKGTSINDAFFLGGTQDEFLALVGFSPNSIAANRFVSWVSSLSFTVPRIPNVWFDIYAQIAGLDNMDALTLVGLGLAAPIGPRALLRVTLSHPLNTADTRSQRLQIGLVVS
jgi:outer membrane protein assembly factor BamA